MKNQAKEGLNIFMDKERKTETKKTPIPPPPKKEIIREKEVHYVDNNISVPPPSAVDLEQVVLGALMIDYKAAEEVMPILIEEVFYDMKHRHVFKAIKILHEKDQRIDLLTISDELKRAGKIQDAGGEYYLIQLTQKVSSSAHIDHHSRIILQKFVLRELIKTSRRTMYDSLHRDPDIFDLLETLKGDIAQIEHIALRRKNGETLTPQEELVAKAIRVRNGERPGIYISVSEFDIWSGGFQPRELITIAARPGMGKTTVGLAISSHIAIEDKEVVGFFSLEMSKTDLSNRIAAKLSGIPYSKIRKADLTPEEEEKVIAALDFLDKTDLHILDTKVHKNYLERIVIEIRRLKKLGCKIVFIDYVQIIKLMKSTGTETGDLNRITGELKALANELDMAIVQFAQLNRAVDNRPGHRPTLADLKQSGSIEQDSDTVIFILREAYYTEKSGIPVPPKVAGDTQFIVAKGRNIGTSEFRTYLDFTKNTFCSYSDAIF